MSYRQLDAFTAAYFEALLWASTDDDGTPLDDNYGIANLDPAFRQSQQDQCERFQRDHAADIACRGAVPAGHDFFLTREGHGAGFWDGDWPEAEGKRLTEASKHYGPVNPYVGDDGLIRGA